MSKECYVAKVFKGPNAWIIEQANEIIEEYQADGYSLTLRQIYYQFVSRAILPNNMQSYKRLGTILNDGRMAGEIDWDAIEDRTRNLRRLPHWNRPSEIISACADQYRIDLWKGQEYRPEVWIEKEALAGVVERAADRLRVPWFCCRGYTSQSEMWSAAMRLQRYIEDGQVPYIIHLGDHDPSGIDMSRDIQDRLNLFLNHHGHDNLDMERIALNYDQVEEYGPPPNPAKQTDSRSSGYIARFGDESWELDALDPKTLDALIMGKIQSLIDYEVWVKSEKEEKKQKDVLVRASNQWDRVGKFLNGKLPTP